MPVLLWNYIVYVLVCTLIVEPTDMYTMKSQKKKLLMYKDKQTKQFEIGWISYLRKYKFKMEDNLLMTCVHICLKWVNKPARKQHTF